MRTVEGHPDFARLEERLVEWIREAKAASPAGPFAPVLVVVPTARLRSYLQVLLAGRFGSLLNVTILEHSSLAREAGAAGLPRTIPRRAREAILEGCLGPGFPRLTDYVRSCPGTLPALLGTMDDLRDAGVEPGLSREVEGLTRGGHEILNLYGLYCAKLAELASAGREGSKGGDRVASGWLTDRAGMRREAARHAGAWARRFDLVLHYGAYDLIGSNLDLMRAIEEGGTRVVYLMPWHPTAPAFEFARRFVSGILHEEPILLDGGSEEIVPERGRTPGAHPQAATPDNAVSREMPAPFPTDRLLGDRLRFLYDEEAPAQPPVEATRLSFFHTQGPEAELRETALRILKLVQAGGGRSESTHAGNQGDARSDAPSGPSRVDGNDVLPHQDPAREHELPVTATHAGGSLPLSRIAVVARSLEPYAPLLGPVLHERFGIPFTTSASLDGAADPHVMAALNLARVVLDDCERQPLLDLARSGLLAPAGGVDPFVEAGEWDLIARKFRIMRGRDAWTRELLHLLKKADLWVAPDTDAATRERAERRREAWRISAEQLGEWLEGLDRDAAALREATTWEAWADALEAFVEARLTGFTGTDDRPTAPGAAALFDALSEMRDLGAAGIPFLQGSGASPSRAALRFLEASAGRARIPIGSIPDTAGGRDNGGVRVLDAMQARGLAFDAVFLIGFNADLIPRRPREDPFLSDEDRALLRERLSRPLPLKSTGREEEHLLLAHLLGSARRHLTISWQRADETGRARVESLSLREVARISLGGAELARIHEAGRTHRAAAHPCDAALEIRDRFGFMPPSDAGVGTFLQVGSPEGVRRSHRKLVDSGLLEDSGNLAPGLDLLAAIESFEPGDFRFDAIVGAKAAPPPGIWSPSRLEDLGNCPQQYFFRHVLRVDELDAILEEHELDIAELGTLAHRVLQDVYVALTAEGHLAGAASEGAGAARRGIELLERKWTDHFSEVATIIHRRFPLMWKGLSALWKNALRTFILHDLSALDLSGSKVLALEEIVETALPIGGGAPPLPVRGRIDRVVLDAAGRLVVGDYKTMGNLSNRVEMARILKGRALQMPLYVLMKESSRAATEGPRIVSAEVLGVGPSFSEGTAPSEPNPEGYPAREILDPDRMGKIREGLLETVRVLVETAAEGCFPLNSDSDRCGWCPYLRACRRGHEPTLARLSGSPGAARYLSLKLKSSRRPLLTAETGGAQDPR